MIIFLLLIVIAKALRLEIDDKTGGFELYEDEIKYFASPENWKLNVNGASSLNVKRNDENEFLWYDEAGHDVMKTSYNQISNDVIVFETCFLQDLKQTNTSSNITESKESALSNFPAFDVVSSDERLGFFGYYNQMLGGMFDGTKYGVWGDTTFSIISRTFDLSYMAVLPVPIPAYRLPTKSRNDENTFA